MFAKVRKFVEEDIWRIRAKGLPPLRAAGLRSLRILLAAARAFREHRCQLRASALTFYSLLSIVPVVAMAFGIAKGFEFEKLLQEKILERFEGQEEVLLEVFGFANSLLENTKGGLVAGVGVILLFWTIIKVLGNIENSFNDIWSVRRDRPLARKITDYLSVMLVAPVLLVLSGSATVFLTTQLAAITAKIDVLGILSPVVVVFLELTPFVTMWVLFTFLYLFMPNRRVDRKSGLVAGVIAGTVYVIVQLVYVKFQVGVAKHNAIYGSFAALPLFLTWLQFSWLIVLAGAEISCVHQNADALEYGPDARGASLHFRRLLALRIVNHVSRNFSAGQVPLTARAVSESLEIPLGLTADLLEDLRASGVLLEAGPHGLDETAYAPARDTDQLTVSFVMDAMDRRGTDYIPVARTEEIERLEKSLEAFGEAIGTSPANLRLKDL
ncbi:MAG TPA: YihY/virulence factor BrkB family protein [Syntrophales bacterium]|nr:YihY/virulence factor BrkB family protein [Syntrophales bacterium]